jgi:hypothetical protein
VQGDRAASEAFEISEFESFPIKRAALQLKPIYEVVHISKATKRYCLYGRRVDSEEQANAKMPPNENRHVIIC